MSLLRPRYLALGFTAYFGIVWYLAWWTAKGTTAAWFNTAISLVVYQTSIVSGVVVLAGLFLAASMSPKLQPAAPESALMTSVKTLRRIERPTPGVDSDAARFAAETAQFLDDPDEPSSGPTAEISNGRGSGRVQLQQAASDPRATPGGLSERLSEIRSRRQAAIVSEGQVTVRVLLRLVDEIQPLLKAARQAGVDVEETSRVIREAATREDSDIAQRVRLVEHAKETLEAALREQLADDLGTLLADVERAKAATANAHRTELAAAEAVALLDTGNFTAAMDRTAKARKAFATPVESPGHRDEVAGPSLLPLVGPSIVAVGYVAISAVLIPGVYGFLERNYLLNTTAILALSYGWLGLALYALASVFIAVRPVRRRAASSEEPRRAA